jgi:replication factor A1
LLDYDFLLTATRRWTVKARAVNKSEMRHWTNAKGEGRLFSVTLIDESGEIKATAFNEAADRLINMFEDNKVRIIQLAISINQMELLGLLC